MLPYASEGLPGIGGALRREPAHFEVVEIPLYTPSGEGEHVYVTLTREGRSTPEIVGELARLYGLAERDIGVAGLKDKFARTTQSFSLPLARLEPRELAARLRVEVHSVARHGNKLRRGHLAGNRFRIVVAEPSADARTRAEAIATTVAARGVPNFFGEQRGGERGRNPARGRELLGDERASRTWAGRLLVSAFQSSLFNEWLALRMQSGWYSRLLDGDVAKRRSNGALFDVRDAALEQPRFDAREIAFTGPIFGVKMRPARAEAGELEQAVLVQSGVEAADFARTKAPGSRRAGVIWVDDLCIDDVAGGLSFEFTLPKGSYATVYLREFMKVD
jgi:tRNA pseudouridine13 synthase